MAKLWRYDESKDTWVKVSEDNPLPTTLDSGDIELGAVELKDATTTNRLAVDSNGKIGLNGISAGENHLGEVGGSSAQIQASPANTDVVYAGTSAAPVCVGGKLTFTNAMRISGGTGILQSLFIKDTDNIKAPLILVLFNQDPTAGTYTDHSAPVFSTDSANIIRAIPISASDYMSMGGIAIADLSPGSRMLASVGTANLYGVLLTTGVPDYNNANVLTVRLGLMRD